MRVYNLDEFRKSKLNYKTEEESTTKRKQPPIVVDTFDIIKGQGQVSFITWKKCNYTNVCEKSISRAFNACLAIR